MSPVRFFLFLILCLSVAGCSGPKDAETAQAVHILGMVKDMYKAHDLPESDSLLLQPVEVFSRKEMKETLAEAYFLQGVILKNNHYLLKAADCFDLAREYCKADSLLLFRINIEQAAMYRLKFMPEEGFIHLNAAEKLLASIRDTTCHVNFLHEKSQYYLKTQKIDDARQCLRQAISMGINTHIPIGKLYTDLSQTFLNEHQTDSTLYYADLALRTADDSLCIKNALLIKSLLYASVNQEDSALLYFSDALGNTTIKEQSVIHRALYEMYCRLHNEPLAYDRLKAYVAAMDSLNYERKEELIEKIHSLDEYKQQRDRANEAEANAASQKIWIHRLTSSILVIILALLLLLFRYKTHKRRQDEELKRVSYLKMEESIRRKDAEMELARKNEELKQHEIDRLSQSIFYYKQLNAITLPILMKSKNKQGAIHLTDEEWNTIVNNADACFNLFSQRLKEFCPSLTDDEIRFCCLVKMELPMAVLAEVYHIAKGSISRRKMRLKEKMSIKQVTFDEFISGF